jgi:hypothetical protein
MIRRPPKIAAFLGLAFLVACSYSSLRAGDGFEPAISVFNPLGSTSSKVTFFVTFPVKGTAGRNGRPEHRHLRKGECARSGT